MQSIPTLLGRRWREAALALTLLLPLLVALAIDPIAQPHGYHDFADQRALFGIPHFVNVASNIAFLAVGALGLALCASRSDIGARACWATFFFGMASIGIGSGYYHLSPDNDTLVWDRLPMTLAFMGLLAALLAEQVNEALGRLLLVPAVAVGMASVAWWHYTGDLRFYGWVQFAPLLAIPVALALFPARYTHRVYLLYGVGIYGLAKLAELLDHQLFSLTRDTLSGHSLKHLLAAMATLFVYLMLRRRQRLRPR
jgi:hypothetical protein